MKLSYPTSTFIEVKELISFYNWDRDISFRGLFNLKYDLRVIDIFYIILIKPLLLFNKITISIKSLICSFITDIICV